MTQPEWQAVKLTILIILHLENDASDAYTSKLKIINIYE